MASVPNSGPAAPPPPPVWEAQATGAAQVAYGGFWIRLVAYIIDAILLTLVVGGLGAMLGFNLMETDLERQDPLFNLAVSRDRLALLCPHGKLRARRHGRQDGVGPARGHQQRAATELHERDRSLLRQDHFRDASSASAS